MSIVNGEKVTPAQPEKRAVIVVAKRCDLCGKMSTGDTDRRAAFGETSDRGNVNEVLIEKATGYSTGYAGDVTVQKFDVCPECWTSKLVPFFASHGAQPRTEREE